MAKVFCIGFHRTGTSSLHHALEMLGLRCKGFDAALTECYAAGERDTLLARVESEHFDAFRDWPWTLLYRELADRFPEARFISTVRDPCAWIESLKRHAARTGPTRPREIVYGHSMPHGHEAEHIAVYCRHNEAVEAFFRSRSNWMLLRTEELTHAFEPLCRFLDRPLAGQPFPHRNQSSPLRPSKF
jgi:sulfotransferase family protein